jgi:hypothetical protein
MLFWNARDLERKRADFQAYDNAARFSSTLPDGPPLRAREALDAECDRGTSLSISPTEIPERPNILAGVP